MCQKQLTSYLALNKIEGFGASNILRLEEKLDDITEILSLSEKDLFALGWQEKQVNQWKKLSWETIEKELVWTEQPHCFILHWHDIRYPQLLKEIHCPPPILYVQGQLESLHRPNIAIVGTRHPTPYGKENAAHFSYSLAGLGFCIVSGLAIGIDGVAHQYALSTPSGTIAVVATGLDRVYPERHKSLANHILEHGALISEFPFNTPPRAEHFPRRNRLISGLSRGVLVIEAAVKSGSLITARYATEQGRDVFAIPGSINNLQAHGCHTLIQQGAILVNNVQDILEEWHITPLISQPSSISKVPHSSPVLHAMNEGVAVSIDTLMEQTGLSFAEVTTQLLELELKGLVERSASGGYIR